MKRIMNIVTILIQFLVILSCTEDASKEYINDRGQTVSEVFYSDDQVKSRTTYLNTQRSESIILNYYEDGILKDSAFFKDGTVEGMRIFYEKEEDLLYEEHYVNGTLNGIHRATYSNGVSSFDGYRRKGRMAGLWQFHYPNGQPITYEFYDSSGVLKYFKKYTEQGLPESTRGDGIISVPSLANDVFAGSSMDLKILIALPPLCRSELLITVSEPGSEPVSIFDQALLNEVLNVPFTFNRAGNYRFSFELKIRSAKDSKAELYVLEKSYTIL